jgi:hypothetical protein
LAHPTGRRGDVVQHPFAVARAEATTKRVPEPAKWVWPAWGPPDSRLPASRSREYRGRCRASLGEPKSCR